METNNNGVKPWGTEKERSNQWALAHRSKTPKNFYMNDIDAFFGKMWFQKNSGYKLFAEYIPDDNYGEVIKKFALISLFDIKETKKAMEYALHGPNPISTAFYLYLARVIGKNQKYDPKFFFVIGKEGPWELIEINIHTGNKTGKSAIISENDVNWVSQYKDLGLLELQQNLYQWFNKK